MIPHILNIRFSSTTILHKTILYIPAQQLCTDLDNALHIVKWHMATQQKLFHLYWQKRTNFHATTFMKPKYLSLPNNLLVFLDTKTLHWFWSSTSNHSRLFYLQQDRSNFCFRFFESFTTSSLQLFFDRPLVLTPIVLPSVTFITSFISILCTCSYHLILCAFIYLTVSSSCISFLNLLLLLILHLSLQWIGPNISLNICLSVVVIFLSFNSLNTIKWLLKI